MLDFSSGSKTIMFFSTIPWAKLQYNRMQAKSIETWIGDTNTNHQLKIAYAPFKICRSKQKTDLSMLTALRDKGITRDPYVADSLIKQNAHDNCSLLLRRDYLCK